MAVGVLADGGGNDRYLSEFSSQGLGHDHSVAFLFDEAGNDSYHSLRTSQGVGNAPGGVGAVLDSRGDDSYYVDFNGISRSSEAVEGRLRPAGLVLDLAGTDTYTRGDGPDGTDLSLGKPGDPARVVDIR